MNNEELNFLKTTCSIRLKFSEPKLSIPGILHWKGTRSKLRNNRPQKFFSVLPQKFQGDRNTFFKNCKFYSNCGRGFDFRVWPNQWYNVDAYNVSKSLFSHRHSWKKIGIFSYVNRKPSIKFVNFMTPGTKGSESRLGRKCSLRLVYLTCLKVCFCT